MADVSCRCGPSADQSGVLVPTQLPSNAWRRASGVPPRLGLKRVGTSRLHAVVHIVEDYEGFPGKCAEDRGAVSSAETSLEEDVIDTMVTSFPGDSTDKK